MSEETRGQKPAQGEDEVLLPPVDVIEDAQGILLRADMPGVPKEALALHVDADRLTIEGEIRLSAPEGMRTTHGEVTLPRYRRVFTLSRELDVERVAAEFVNGVLTLRIPRVQQAAPRRIRIDVA